MRRRRATQVLSLRDLDLPSEKSWTLADSLFRRSAPYTQTKNGGSFEPPFFFYFLANLLKSRVFAINITGLFFPASRVEQAHFSHLTTCLTTYGDFFLIFGYFLIFSRQQSQNCDAAFFILLPLLNIDFFISLNT